jgi:DNA-binding MarR family transcriptional regulator
MVNTMNDYAEKKRDVFLSDQTQKLRNLITEMNKCCEDRHLIEKKKFALPIAEMKCIVLFKEEKYLTVKGIAIKLGVAKSRVTKLIDNLSRKGLVNKIDDPEDARIKLISLSPKGKALVGDIQAFQELLYEEILIQFDGQARKNLLTDLEMLRSAMDVVKKKFKL